MYFLTLLKYKIWHSQVFNNFNLISLSHTYLLFIIIIIIILARIKFLSCITFSSWLYQPVLGKVTFKSNALQNCKKGN